MNIGPVTSVVMLSDCPYVSLTHSSHHITPHHNTALRIIPHYQARQIIYGLKLYGFSDEHE